MVLTEYFGKLVEKQGRKARACSVWMDGSRLQNMTSICVWMFFISYGKIEVERLFYPRWLATTQNLYSH